MVIFAVHPVEPQGTTTVSSHATAVIVIPARYDSSRLPGKPLAEISGRPMIEHVYRRAASASGAASVLVATDDKRIQDAVVAFGGKAQLTESSHRNGMERLAEVAEGLSCDLVVNVQGDEPLLDPSTIEIALRPFSHDSSLCMSSLRTPLKETTQINDRNIVKVVVDQNDFALYFSRSAIPGLHDLHGSKCTTTVNKHVGLYVYRRDFLIRLAGMPPTPLEESEQLEQLRALEHGYRIKVLETAHNPIGVDTAEDLETVRQIMITGASQ
tara:strand:+ start:10394 stop:11200 length:807 start_codon:yes stop_codon:yes gene_type:complete